MDEMSNRKQSLCTDRQTDRQTDSVDTPRPPHRVCDHRTCCIILCNENKVNTSNL